MLIPQKLPWHNSSDSKVLGFFFIFFALSVVFFARLWLVGDGVAYYAWLRSILFDHDIQFLNELTTFNITKSSFALDSIVSTSLTPNTFSIGPALVWSIVVIPLHVLWSWIQPNNLFTGYELRYLATISLTSILVIFSGLVLCYVMVRKKLAPSLAFLVTLLLWLGSPLPQYLYDEMQYAHGFSLLFVSLFILYWIQKRKIFTNKHAVVLGLLGGCMMLMRWQDALFLLIPCLDSFLLVTRKKYSQCILPLLVMFLNAFIVFSPQLIAWKALYGQWIIIPQGNGFFEFSTLFMSTRILDFLFSPNHGLLYCHPLFLVGFMGLLFGLRKETKKERPLIIALLCVLTLQILLNASVGDWAIYHSFGVRRMIDCLPIIGYGIALLLQHLQIGDNLKVIISMPQKEIVVAPLPLAKLAGKHAPISADRQIHAGLPACPARGQGSSSLISFFYGITYFKQFLQYTHRLNKLILFFAFSFLLLLLNGFYWFQYRTIIDHGGQVNWILIISNIPRMPWLILEVLKQSTFFQLLHSSFLDGLLYLFFVIGMLLFALVSLKKLLLSKKDS